MRRVRWVRVLVQPDGRTVCHVLGTSHRLPVVRRVSLATAMRLADDGVPFVVRTPSGAPRPPAG